MEEVWSCHVRICFEEESLRKGKRCDEREDVVEDWEGGWMLFVSL